MFNIHNNFFFKIIGICAILFFAIDNQKDHPDLIISSISESSFEKNAQQIKYEIANVANKARIAKKIDSEIKSNDIDKKIIVVDEIESFAQNALKCGDNADINIEVRDKKNNILHYDRIIINIGQNNYPLIEKNITGMKIEGVRVIIIPALKVSLSKFINKANLKTKQDIVLRITLHNIIKSNNKSNCT